RQLMSRADIRSSRLSECVWGEPKGKQAKRDYEAKKLHFGEQHTLEGSLYSRTASIREQTAFAFRRSFPKPAIIELNCPRCPSGTSLKDGSSIANECQNVIRDLTGTTPRPDTRAIPMWTECTQIRGPEDHRVVWLCS